MLEQIHMRRNYKPLPCPWLTDQPTIESHTDNQSRPILKTTTVRALLMNGKKIVFDKPARTAPK